MNDDPLTAVYDFVERAYIRLQAGEVLNHCLDKGNSVPIQNLVEGLVLVGPQSLSVLREIIAEVISRKTQLTDDRNQIYHKLAINLKQHGVSLTGQCSSLALTRLTPVAFLTVLHQQGITDEKAQRHCLRLLHNTLDLLGSLSDNYKLLDEIEVYLQDWLWVLIYQSAQQEWTDGPSIAPDAKLPL
jgi:hypothetical protein